MSETMEPCAHETHTGCLTAECTVLRAEWLVVATKDLPVGCRVAVNARTDVRDYEGARGRVVGYDMQAMETPLVRVEFDGSPPRPYVPAVLVALGCTPDVSPLPYSADETTEPVTERLVSTSANSTGTGLADVPRKTRKPRTVKAPRTRKVSTVDVPATWGEPYGGTVYVTPDGQRCIIYRKGQRCRWIAEDGTQVGPEQSNVAPAIAYALAHGWQNPPSKAPDATVALEALRAQQRREIEALRAENVRLRASAERRGMKIAA